MRLDIIQEMEEKIFDMEKASLAFNIEPFDIFLMGGAACVLGDYTKRATRDFDFIDQNYSPQIAKAIVQLRDFDMLEYQSIIVSPNYKIRAKKLEKFKYINVYLLSPEDIIVSKIIRFEEKDIGDIDSLIKNAERDLINQIIDEVLSRDDLFESKKEGFIKQLEKFKERYYV